MNNDAKLQQALGAYQQGLVQQAELLCRELLMQDATSVQTLHLLAVTLHRTKQYEEAISLLRRALTINPSFWEAANELGAIYFSLNRYQDALDVFKSLTQKDPHVLDGWVNQGLALTRLGKHEEALLCYQQALIIKPNAVVVLNYIGNILEHLHRYPQALQYYSKALNLAPRNIELIIHCAKTLAKLKRHQDALVLIDHALNDHKDNIKLLMLQGSINSDQGHHLEAVNSFNKVLALNHNIFFALTQKGSALQHLGRQKEAIGVFDEALLLKPNAAPTLNNKANALSTLQQYDAAIACFDAAIAADPNYHIAIYNRSQVKLLCQDFKTAWVDHEARWHTTHFIKNRKALRYSDFNWGDPSNASKTLMLWAEQGIGDEILYASMFNEVKARFAKVVIGTDDKLINLFARSFPDMEVINRDTYFHRVPMGTENVLFMPIGSLGLHLRTSIDDFKHATTPYLKADEIKTNHFRQEFKTNGKKNIVGLSWRSKHPSIGAEKSISMEFLATQLKTIARYTQFVCLQYLATKEELQLFESIVGDALHVPSELDTYHDIDGLAAAISACDVVLTSSNATAHVAGAIGQKTFVLIPQGDGLRWYWGTTGEAMLWYPSVKIIRQVKLGDWEYPLHEALKHIA